MPEAFDLTRSDSLGTTLTMCADGVKSGQLKAAQIYIVALEPCGEFHSAVYTLGNANLDYIVEAVLANLRERRKEEEHGKKD